MAGPPGANPMSTANPDAELVARGERFEKFLLEYMDAWLEWAPLMRAARAQVGLAFVPVHIDAQRSAHLSRMFDFASSTSLCLVWWLRRL
jgi:hypothetical protein